MSARDNLEPYLQIDPFPGFEADYPPYGYHGHMKACPRVSLGAEVGVFRRWNGGQNGCIWKLKRGLKRVGLGVEVGAEMVGEWNEMTMRLFLAVTKLPPMQTDDEPMWVADHVVAPTPGSAITIPETANEFAIKADGIFLYKTPNQAYQLLEDKVLLKLNWAKNQKTKSSLKKTVTFADEGSSNSDTEKIMARMDAMTLKMDA
ncbi:hypothetical protein Tco_0619537 [Tanacetum coccineum]